MAGFKEFAHEIRKRDTHYPNATGKHVAMYAMDNNRVYIIDENGGLVDFQIKDGYFNDVQISGQCLIVGQDVVTDTVIDGHNLIFRFDSSQIVGEMANTNPSGADWQMDVYSISGVGNGFNQLRIFDNNDGKTYISVRKDGSVIIGDYADTIDDDGHTVQVYGSAIVTGELTSPKGNVIAQDNEAFGKNALTNVINGGNNVAVGANSMTNCANGYANVAVGNGTLLSISNGYHNVAVGFGAMLVSSGVSRNVAVGSYVLQNSLGDHNVSVGYNSSSVNAGGYFNTIIGSEAFANNNSGNYNVAVGKGALESNIDGSGNVAIGYFAGQSEMGSNKLYIANSGGTSGDALIYGEFDVPHVYVNGRLTIRGNISESSIESVSFVNTGSTVAATRYLINKNSSGISSYTITFPPAPTNGQLFTFVTLGAITTLSMIGATANIVPSTAAANDRFTWIYNEDNSMWVRIY